MRKVFLNAYQLSNLIVQSLKDAVHGTRQKKLSEPFISIVFPFFSPRKKKSLYRIHVCERQNPYSASTMFHPLSVVYTTA